MYCVMSSSLASSTKTYKYCSEIPSALVLDKKLMSFSIKALEVYNALILFFKS